MHAMHLARKRFLEQKQSAKTRRIGFKFGFEEWCNWWERHLGRDWLNKRGSSAGKFCMARKGDSGCYEVGNVMCILHAQNISDASANNSCAFGINAGRAKLDEPSVRHIFKSKAKYGILASRFGITTATVCDIRSGRTWRRVTKSLNRKTTRGRNQWK
jgi:hypothetical protein